MCILNTNINDHVYFHTMRFFLLCEVAINEFFCVFNSPCNLHFVDWHMKIDHCLANAIVLGGFSASSKLPFPIWNLSAGHCSLPTKLKSHNEVDGPIRSSIHRYNFLIPHTLSHSTNPVFLVCLLQSQHYFIKTQSQCKSHHKVHQVWPQNSALSPIQSNKIINKQGGK